MPVLEHKVQWARRGLKGAHYEVSSRGDMRFSAFAAIMPDGRSIEEHYQCDVKGYNPGGIDWRLGKGKPPLDLNKDLWSEYLALWKTWAHHHSDLIADLMDAVSKNGYMLTDMFAHTDINQARALAEILNEIREATT